MSYSTEEIEDIKKRLTVLEKQDLLIAKAVSRAFCALQYNIWLGQFSGEELNSYTQRWGKQIDATKKEIDDSRTVERAFEIAKKFEEELFAYIRATKVATADKAM